MKKIITNGRITKWMLLLQEFNITILDQRGKYNQVADFLSKINSPKDLIPVSDNFPDEHLFSVIAKTTWFADIENYFSSGILPSHFTNKKKRKIIK